MNTYVTALTIKQLRECRDMTQAELSEKIGVSSKTISKWETAKGLPDISLLQPLAKALGVYLSQSGGAYYPYTWIDLHPAKRVVSLEYAGASQVPPVKVL